MTENKHRIGWWRSFYYYMNWQYESENDKPLEKDVLKKSVLCKQITLSKLKLKKVSIEEKIPFDLKKIDTTEKKVPMPLYDTQTPNNTPKFSQKQIQHIYGTRYSNKNNLP